MGAMVRNDWVLFTGLEFKSFGRHLFLGPLILKMSQLNLNYRESHFLPQSCYHPRFRHSHGFISDHWHKWTFPGSLATMRTGALPNAPATIVATTKCPEEPPASVLGHWQWFPLGFLVVFLQMFGWITRARLAELYTPGLSIPRFRCGVYTCIMLILCMYNAGDCIPCHQVPRVRVPQSTWSAFISTPTPSVLQHLYDGKYEYHLDVDTVFRRSGSPPHPGPAAATTSVDADIETITTTITCQNITSLTTNISALPSLVHDYCFVQETSLTKSAVAAAYHDIRPYSLKSLLTHSDPELQHATGGMGCFFKPNLRAHKLVPHTPQMASIMNNGRIQYVGIPTSTGTQLSVINLYGWSGSHGNPELLERTSDMIEAVIHEVSYIDTSPFMICGDLNCDLEDVASLVHAIDSGFLVNLGTCAHLGEHRKTCYPYYGEPSTRDYVLVSPSLLPFIHQFQVIDNGLPVDRSLITTIKMPTTLPKVIFCRKLPTIGDQFQQHVDRKCEEDKSLDKKALLQSITDDYQTAVSHSFAQAQQQLHDYATAKDTCALWLLWTTICARATTTYITKLANGSKLHKEYRQLGCVNTKSAPVFKSTTTNAITGELVYTSAHRKLANLAKQLTRITTLVCSLHSYLKCRKDSVLQAAMDQYKALVNNWDCDEMPQGFQDLLSVDDITANAIVFRFKVLQTKLTALVESAKKDRLKQSHAARRDFLLNEPHFRSTFKQISGKQFVSLTALRDSNGTITTDPTRIDQLVQQAWQRVYDGNSDDHPSTISKYLAKYASYIAMHSSFTVDPITVEELRNTCSNYPRTAVGLDSWSPNDIALLPDVALAWVTQLFTLLESGSPWPPQLCHAGGHLLQKPDSDPLMPLSFRVLTISSAIYRVWAKIRLAHLQPWMDTWQLPEMHAGFKQVGAEDAWYSTGLDLEHARLNDLPAVGGSLDLYKCFDQIIRPMLYAVLAISGIPINVLACYMNFQEALQIRFHVLNTIGTPHHHKCGIPQGCPLSMVCVALFLRPVVMQARHFNTKLRILADDLLLMTIGKLALRRFALVFNLVMIHLVDLGGKIAPDKSKLFSTMETYRQWLATYQWPSINSTIRVFTHFRDLGSQINVSGAHITVVSANRTRVASQVVYRITRLPHSLTQKARFMLASAHNMAFYGCEASPFNVSSITSLSTSIVRALGSSVQSHSQPMVYLLSGHPYLEPFTYIYRRRINLFTRFFTQWPSYVAKLHEILAAYNRIGYPGLHHEQLNISQLEPAPLPGQPNRDLWWTAAEPCGPIGLILQQTHQMAATLDVNTLTIRSKAAVDFHLLTSPFKGVKQMVSRMSNYVLSNQAIHNRTILNDMATIDNDVFDASMSHRNQQDMNIIRAVATFSTIDTTYLRRIHAEDSDLCVLCGETTGDLLHHIYYCQHRDLASARNDLMSDTTCKAILDNIDIFPKYLMRGIPNTLQSCPCQPFWDSKSQFCNVVPNDAKPIFGITPHEADTNGFVEWSSLQHHTSAANLLANHIGSHRYPSALELPSHINDYAPSKPDVFSDGGLYNPELSQFGLATFGVVWTCRTISDLTTIESDDCFAENIDGYLGLSSFQPSLSYSSFRSELMALIVVAHVSIPLHIALDNKGVVDIANQLITWVLHNDKPFPGKPLKLYNDGDFWEAFFNALVARGAHSIKVTHTVGQIYSKKKEKYLASIANNPQKLLEGKLNQLADDLATKGRTHYAGVNEFKLAKLCASRFKDYTKLLQGFHTIIVRMYLALDSVRKPPAFVLSSSSLLSGICHSPAMSGGLRFAMERSKESLVFLCVS